MQVSGVHVGVDILRLIKILKFPKFVAVTAMHEEDEMQKGRMSLSFIDVIDFVSSGPCCELLACLTVGIAVCGSYSRCERIECFELVYIAGSSSRRSALICPAQVRTLPHSQQRLSSKVLGFWQSSRPRKLFSPFCRSSLVVLCPPMLP